MTSVSNRTGLNAVAFLENLSPKNAWTSQVPKDDKRASQTESGSVLGT
jgi:hypothetical protein